MTNPAKRAITTAVVHSIARPMPTTLEPRHDGWTRERMIGFLETLVETASVSIAAHCIGSSCQSASAPA